MHRQHLKRSSEDMDESDECLPISKRINSLHIEGQSNGLIHKAQDNNNACTYSGLNGNGTASSSQSFNKNDSHGSDQMTAVPGYDIKPQSSDCEVGASNYYSGQHFYRSMSEPVYHNQIDQSRLHRDNELSHQMSSEPCSSRTQNSLCQGYSQSSTGSTSHPAHDVGHSPFLNDQQTSYYSGIPHGQLAALQNIQALEPKPPFQNGFPCQANELDFHSQQLPSGTYEPELSLAENPFYFNINQLLYEAHLSRVRRENSFSGNS